MIRQVSNAWMRFLAVAVVLSSCVAGQMGTPIPITPEPFEAHVVLAYGRGISTSRSVKDEAFAFLALPELTIYDNGLMLFSCRHEAWPEICQSQIALETVVKLINELDAFGVFEGRYYPNARLGPSTYFSLKAQKDQSSRVESTSWTSASIDRSRANLSADQQRLSSVLAILDRVLKDLISNKSVYQPKYAALWIMLLDKCPANQPPNCTEPWPFKFSSRISIVDKDCEIIEVPQLISEIRSAIPDFDKHSLDEEYFFQDGNNNVSVQIRPYLPGEAMPTQCAWEHHRSMAPSYSLLPFFR